MLGHVSNDKPLVALSERAARHVRGFLERSGNGIGLRLGVKPTGCSGYQYVVSAAEQIADGDTCFDSHGVRVVVDRKSLPLLAGTEVDFVREGLNEGFRFNNPNVAGTCGCGESFSIEDPDTPAGT